MLRVSALFEKEKAGISMTTTPQKFRLIHI